MLKRVVVFLFSVVIVVFLVLLRSKIFDFLTQVFSGRGEMILTIFGGVALLLVIFPFFAQALAKHNLFFTLVEEGEAKIILHNKAFKKAVIQYQEFRLDERGNVVADDRVKKERGTQRLGKLFDRFNLMGGGLVWVGIWPLDTVYTYNFRWTGLKKGGPVEHDEILDYVYVKSEPYHAKLTEAETPGMVPLDIEMVLTIRVVSPYRAIFRTHQWLEFAISRISPYVRQYIAKEGGEFQKIVSAKQGPDGDLYKSLETSRAKFTPEMKEDLKGQGKSEKEIEIAESKDKGILWVLWEIFGIDIQSIEFLSISAGQAEKEAADKKWKAEREKEAILVAAHAEAERIRIVAKAEAGRIRTVSQAIKDYGEIALASKAMDTLKDANTKWIIPSGMMDVFESIRGNLKGKKKRKGSGK